MSFEGVWGILRKSEADLGMIISYDFVANFPGWVMAEDYFKSLIAEHGCKQILEVGAGANPTLSPQFVQANHLSYVASDLSAEELQKRDLAFERLVLDLSAESVDPSLTGRFDCVLSRMVGEHVSNGNRYHRNIYKILRPGGISAHCFSTLWTLPFIANRYLPERAGNILQNIFSPRDGHLHGKFKAHYSWSRGPSSLMIKRFQKIGFEVLAYTGYFGHWYYQIRFPWLHRLEMSKTKLLLKHPVPQLCSYATFVLRKPR
jgi:2-polyprenyl-3-methyl-5-hydroxy-6-metoxy-1,4-benzoquinol methylase